MKKDNGQKTNDINPVIAKSIADTLTLTSVVEVSLDKLKQFKDENPRIANNLTLKKGKKYWLEIEVVDETFTEAFFRWLYQKGDNAKSLQLFGCNLNAITFSKGSYDKDEIKRKLNAFIEENF